MKFINAALLSASALSCGTVAPAKTEHHWSYTGETGPPHWASLEPDYASCGLGKEQSPINIETAKVRREQLPGLIFNYKRFPLHIIDNGHTIQVNVPPGSTLSVQGHAYELVQFHFHHPSEEMIDGKLSQMVAHLVHRDAKGQLAVVAVLVHLGAENPLLGTLWQNIPHEKGHEASPAGVVIDAANLLPTGRGYFSYSGSLTTPPCTEGVRWFLLKSPTTSSANQIAIFSKLYGANARQVQPLNGRVVLSSQ